MAIAMGRGQPNGQKRQPKQEGAPPRARRNSKAKDEGLFQGDQFQVQLHSKAQDSVRIGDCEPKGSAVILILLTALSVELQLKIWP